MTVAGEARNFTATITILDAGQNTIGGPFDVSEAVSAWKVNFAGLNLSGPNGYRPWTGELFLEDGIVSENIDAWDTTASPAGASLLAPGNAIDLRVWDGAAYARSWPTLYILRVPSPFDPLSSGERNVSIELGDITQLRNLRSPEGKLSRTMALGTSTTRSAIANAALSDVGLPTSADVVTKYPLSVPPQKFSQGSTPNELGRLLGTAGYNFWVDSTDAVRLTAIDIDKSAPDFTLTIGTDEFGPDGWVRRNLAERPPVKLIVTAAGGRAIAKDNPFTSESLKAEKETRFSREIFSLSNRVVESTEILESEREILPRIPTQSGVSPNVTVTGYTVNASTALRLSFRETITREYSGITGLIKNEIILIEQAKGKAGGDAFRETDTVSDAYDTITVSNTTIAYSFSNGLLSARVTRVQRPWALIPWKVRPSNYEVNRFLTQTNLTIDEEWGEQLFGKNWEYSIETRRPQGERDNYYGDPINAEVLREDPNESETIESSDGGDATPPTSQDWYIPLLYEQSDDQYSGEVTVTPLAGNAHKNAEETVSIQGPYGVSNAQCDELAQLIARMRHGLNLGQQGIFSIPPWILSSFTPNPRIDITDNGVVRSYALNGWTITADSDSTLWGGTFARLGDVGLTPDAVTPPVGLTLSALAIGGSVVGGSGGFFAPEVFSSVGGSVVGGSGSFAATRFSSAGGLVIGGSGSLATPGVASSAGGLVIGGAGTLSEQGIDSIPSLVGRYRADSSINNSDVAPSNGDGIKQLINLVSGNADGSVQSTTTLQPIYNSSSANFNSRPTISTDGVDDELLIPFSSLISGNDFTLVHVFRFTSTASLQVGPRDTDVNISTVIVGYTTNNTQYYRINNTFLGTAYNISTESGTVARYYTFHKSGSTGEVFRDGVSRGTVSVGSTKDIGSNITIGKNGGNAFWSALEWAETLIFDTGLSAPELTTVNNELGTYYGI